MNAIDTLIQRTIEKPNYLKKLSPSGSSEGEWLNYDEEGLGNEDNFNTYILAKELIHLHDQVSLHMYGATSDMKTSSQAIDNTIQYLTKPYGFDFKGKSMVMASNEALFEIAKNELQNYLLHKLYKDDEIAKGYIMFMAAVRNWDEVLTILCHPRLKLDLFNVAKIIGTCFFGTYIFQSKSIEYSKQFETALIIAIMVITNEVKSIKSFTNDNKTL